MALGLGFGNPMPLTLGGGESVVEVELEALLDAYAPAWDRSEGTANHAECRAYAQSLAIIWAVNQRLVNQTIPMRMLETLTVWETVLSLRPGPDASAIDRRRAVAAKLRGFATNTIGDINDACANLMGANFSGLTITDPADVIAYWPGMNPGPPGFEWSTNRLTLGVRVNKSNIGESEYADKTAQLASLLDLILPAWMTFQIGVDGDGFVCDVGICDETLL